MKATLLAGSAALGISDEDKPELLSERLDFVANAEPSAAADGLRRLVEETRAVVKAEMPDLDVDVPWQPPIGNRSGSPK